jgi:hypothetical protein
LYAIEDAASTDLGIGLYSITMSGATAINNRSPFGTATNGNGDPVSWGMSGNGLRSGTNVNPIASSQPLYSAANPLSTPQILGFGRTANNAVAVLTAIDPGATNIVANSGASWGAYNNSALLPL